MEHKVNLSKSFHGWEAKTMIQHNGFTWRINTMKTNNGAVVCSAHRGDMTESGSFTCLVIGGSKNTNLKLVTMQGKATEKFIAQVHAIGLKEFDLLISSGILAEEKNTFAPGQVVSYEDQANAECKFVVTSEKASFGFNAYSLNGKSKTTVSIDEIEGLGGWKLEKEFLSMEQIESIKNIYLENQAAQLRESVQQKQEVEAKILKGLEKIKIPEGAVSVIIAEYKNNESDPQTDYYGSSTEKTIYLAWSNHDRNLFPEMRKAALNCPDTAFMAEAPKEWENKQNYTGGGGYFLAEHRYSGWNIRKSFYSIDRIKNELALAIEEGRFFIPQATNEERKTIETTSHSDIQIIDYSEKAIALKGDTKPIKDQLKSLGGRFNPRLTNPVSGEIFMGWIFPKSKQVEVVKLVS